jgi:Fructose-2,6-bisphosphatase
MVTYKMHLIRTGGTDVGETRKFVGQLDLPLHPEKEKELAALARHFLYPQVEMLFSSPLTRCTKTAEILYPNTLTETLEDLSDMHLGRFEGKTFEQLRGDPDFSLWIHNSAAHTPPGGESAGEFAARIGYAVSSIFQRMMDEGMRDVAVVTHNGVIMTLLAAIGLPKRPLNDWVTPNGHGFTLLFTPEMWMRDRSAEVFALIPQELPESREDFDFD